MAKKVAVWLAVAAAVLLLPLAFAFGAFVPTKTPVSPSGARATVDLPVSQHMANVGGSDGSGLCVFTSIVHTARWQGIRELDGYRDWMQRREGGGWPQKVDQTLRQFCKEKGVSIPLYIQHTGGDPAFLELALKTGRMPCITYAGMDDFYFDRWGRPATIAHMVNLAYLDSERAAIIDNNRPGVWVWMTRKELLDRWVANRGGWAIVFLSAPPPPHLAGGVLSIKFKPVPLFPSAQYRVETMVAANEFTPDGEQVFGQCPGGVCPVPFRGFVNPVTGPLIVPNVMPGPIGDPKPVGDLGAGFEWKNLPGVGWGWVQVEKAKKAESVAVAPAPVEAADEKPVNYGIDNTKIHTQPEYTINGIGVDKYAVQAVMAGGGPFADDSDRWHLTAVGDTAALARFKADVAELPEDVRAKLLIQSYGPAEWPVVAFALPVGVSLRKPSVNREAAEVGTVKAADYDAAKLLGLLQSTGGPVPAPAKPAPANPVNPAKPDSPVNPAAPVVPAPAPAPAGNSLALWVTAFVALLVAIFKRKV